MVGMQFYWGVAQLIESAKCFSIFKASISRISIPIAWVSVEGADKVVTISHDTV